MGFKLSELCEAQARAFFTTEEAARAISDVTHDMKPDPDPVPDLPEGFDWNALQRLRRGAGY